MQNFQNTNIGNVKISKKPNKLMWIIPLVIFVLSIIGFSISAASAANTLNDITSEIEEKASSYKVSPDGSIENLEAGEKYVIVAKVVDSDGDNVRAKYSTFSIENVKVPAESNVTIVTPKYITVGEFETKTVVIAVGASISIDIDGKEVEYVVLNESDAKSIASKQIGAYVPSVIAGMLVGLAVMIFIIFLIIYLVKNNKYKKQESMMAQNNPFMQQPVGQQMQQPMEQQMQQPVQQQQPMQQPMGQQMQQPMEQQMQQPVEQQMQQPMEQGVEKTTQATDHPNSEGNEGQDGIAGVESELINKPEQE